MARKHSGKHKRGLMHHIAAFKKAKKGVRKGTRRTRKGGKKG